MPATRHSTPRNHSAETGVTQVNSQVSSPAAAARYDLPRSRSRPHLLVIASDHEPAELRRAFEREGYDVRTIAIAKGEGGGRGGMLESLVSQCMDIDAIILEIEYSEVDGYHLLQTLRSRGFDTPILVLSASATEADAVRALRAGADDYVTKPYGFMELLARIEALRRRAGWRRAQPAASL